MKQHLQKLLYMALTTCVLIGGLPGAGGQTQAQGSLANTNVTAQQQHETHSQLFLGQNLETIPDILTKTSGDIYLRYDQPTGFPMAPLNPPAYPPIHSSLLPARQMQWSLPRPKQVNPTSLRTKDSFTPTGSLQSNKC